MYELGENASLDLPDDLLIIVSCKYDVEEEFFLNNLPILLISGRILKKFPSDFEIGNIS